MTKPLSKNPVGPGSHELKSSFGVGPKFSMSQRMSPPRDAKLPGPGYYEYTS